MIRYGSVCSGIEAATQAWHPLGWQPQWFAEIEPFPSAVLAHRWPGIPNIGDFTVEQDLTPIDLLVGGTPCQDFSVAGLRAGMAGDRGALTLQFLRLARRARPRWVVWENVPGVLSIDGGRAFGALLGGLAELGYGWAYRVLDAQFFGVAQRRRRVFVVGCLGDRRAAAAVLFERACLRGDPPPSRKAGEDVAGTIGGGSQGRGWSDDLDRSGAFVPEAAHTFTSEGFDASEDGSGRGPQLVAPTLNANGRAAGSATQQDAEAGALVYQCQGGSVGPAGTLLGGDNVTNGVPFVASAEGAERFALSASSGKSGNNQSPLVAFDLEQITNRTNRTNRSNPQPGDPVPTIAGARMAVAQVSDTLTAHHSVSQDNPPLAFHTTQTPTNGDVVPTMGSQDQSTGGVLTPRGGVRRLTPREYERLFGFPDDYTLIPLPLKKRQSRVRWSADGPRYRALGNSMAVPCMFWIGRRIQMVEDILENSRRDSKSEAREHGPQTSREP